MRLLVIRLSSLGDVILTTPFLRALRRRFPEVEVHFLTKKAYAGLLETHPVVDEVVAFDSGERGALKKMGARLRANGYDAVFDLHKNLRSVPLARMSRASRVYRIDKATLRRRLLIDFKIDLLRDRGDMSSVYIEVGKELGLEDDDAPPDVYPTKEACEKAEARLAGLARPLWGLVPVASSWNKRWPHFAAFGRTLVEEKGGTCLVFGGPEDAELCESIAGEIGPDAVSLAGKATPLEMAALLQRCVLAVGNDTGPMHLSVAVGTPTAALFGPTTRQLGYYPRGGCVRVLEREMDCRPCTRNGLEYCPRRRDLACLREITAEDVLESCRELLAGVTLEKR